MIDALKIDIKDNVAIVVKSTKANEVLKYKDLDGTNKKVKTVIDIPIFHKVSLKDIKPGERIIKYGEYIGEASCEIRTGDHVHVHNVISISENIKKGVSS